MRFRIIGLVTLALANSLFASTAFAQRSAASKLTGEAYSVHAQSMHQRHAADRANLLYRYSTAPNPVPKAVVQEQMAGVRKDLTAAKTELAKSKQAHSSDMEIRQLLTSIEKHYAQCEEHCKTMDDDSKMADMQMVHTCCGKMCEEMQAAEADLEKVMKKLGIKKLEPMMPATVK